ncbi:DUF4352 domain-containing protein [Methanogenium marinum]|uniref:DUF4352 domain-containing protein n=1 Tax=Methanogenium marinum TaxID=348610 RepID=A0A9Q4KVC0_9EURY|nr:DUF4352 domain-containing protein [Methanogenium marinum]MDE4908190.1 DUF4352 domain-containing protein [Methanogenium marinum]
MSLTKIYVIAIAICFILFAGCVGSDDSNIPPEDTTPVPTATYEPDPQPSETVANTIDVETVGLNEILTIQNPQVNAEISVDEVIRGSRANTIVAESSPESDMFSSEPVHGYEYLMVHIRIKNTDDYSLAVSPYFDLPVYASGGSYDQESVDLEGYQVLEPTTLLSDEEINGWIVYMVPVGERVVLAYEPLLPDEPLGFIRLS